MLNENMISHMEEVADEEAVNARTIIDSFWIIHIGAL